MFAQQNIQIIVAFLFIFYHEFVELLTFGTSVNLKVKNKEVHTKCYRCMSCNVAFIDENGKRIQSAHIVGSRILCKEHASAILVQDFDAWFIAK